MTGSKMITCCYCGARDIVTMGKGKRMALNCLTCGAPVRKMEAVKISAPPVTTPAPTPEKVNKHRRPPHFDAVKKRKKSKKKKSRKSIFSRIWDEAEDLIEDIFD